MVFNTATELEIDRLHNLYWEYVPLFGGPYRKSASAQVCTIVSLEKCEKIYLKRHKLRGFEAAPVCVAKFSLLRGLRDLVHGCVTVSCFNTSRKFGKEKRSSLGNQQLNVGDLQAADEKDTTKLSTKSKTCFLILLRGSMNFMKSELAG